MQKTFRFHDRWAIRRPYLRRDGCSPFYYVPVYDLREGRKKLRTVASGVKDPLAAIQVAIQHAERWEKEEKSPAVEKGRKFSQVWGEWLKATKADLEERYVETLRSDGNLLQAKLPVLVADIELRHLEELVAWLRETGRARGTIRKHVQNVRACVRWAASRKFLAEDALRDYRLPPVRKGAPRYVARALSIDEVRALVAAAGTPREIRRKRVDGTESTWPARAVGDGWLALAVRLATLTGLRRRSLVELNWSMVDLDGTRPVLSDDGKTVLAEEPGPWIDVPAGSMKMGRRFTLPLSPSLVAELAKVPPEKRTGALLGGRKMAHRTLHGAAERAGIGAADLGWHSFRRAYASLLGSDVPHVVLQRLMGHAAGDVTAGYVHVPWSRLVEAIGRLPAL